MESKKEATNSTTRYGVIRYSDKPSSSGYEPDIRSTNGGHLEELEGLDFESAKKEFVGQVIKKRAVPDTSIGMEMIFLDGKESKSVNFFFVQSKKDIYSRQRAEKKSAELINIGRDEYLPDEHYKNLYNKDAGESLLLHDALQTGLDLKKRVDYFSEANTFIVPASAQLQQGKIYVIPLRPGDIVAKRNGEILRSEPKPE
jgi:hypothetical protein